MAVTNRAKVLAAYPERPEGLTKDQYHNAVQGLRKTGKIPKYYDSVVTIRARVLVALKAGKKSVPGVTRQQFYAATAHWSAEGQAHRKRKPLQAIDVRPKGTMDDFFAACDPEIAERIYVTRRPGETFMSTLGRYLSGNPK